MRISPSFCVILSQAGIEVVVVEPLRAILMREDRSRLRMLLEVLNIVRGVAALQRGEISGAPMLSLPEKVLPERLGELGGEHVPPGGAW